MPRVTYPLEPGGAERLQISWEGSFRDGAVILDGELLGGFAGAKELKSGKSFTLKDGSRLSVKLGKNFIGLPELQPALNGERIRTDARKRLGAAWGVIAFVGALNVLVGMVGEAFSVGFLAQMGVGWASILSGLVYLGLGILVMRRSRAALVGAIALFALDGVATLASAAKATGAPPVSGLIMRVFLLVPMVGGFQALTDLERAARRPRRRPAPAKPPRPASDRTASPPAPRPEVRAQERRVEEVRTAPAASGHRAMRAASPAPTKGWGTDVAGETLRGAAHRCELTEGSIKVFYRDLKQRELSWSELTGVAVRQLPLDPPWDGQLVLDIAASGTPSLVRILPGTFVNYGTLPGGASSSRLENMRKLLSHVAGKRPDLPLDDDTSEFARGGKAPQRFAALAAFVEYDSRYG
jgi:hypothetical protein